MEDLQDKIIELMDLFDGEVTTADKIDRPQRALDREAIDDFMKRNPMAGGGMLVQPSADGSRPGYRQPPSETSQNFIKYVRSLDKEVLATKTIDDLIKDSGINIKKDTASGQLNKNNPDLKYKKVESGVTNPETQKKITEIAGAKKNKRIETIQKVNNWTNNWFQNNAGKYDSYEKAKTQLIKDWKKESKNKIYSGSNFKLSLENGMPNIAAATNESTSATRVADNIFDITFPIQRSNKELIFQKGYANYRLQNPTFNKKINDYFDLVILDKRGFNTQQELIKSGQLKEGYGLVRTETGDFAKAGSKSMKGKGLLEALNIDREVLSFITTYMKQDGPFFTKTGGENIYDILSKNVDPEKVKNYRNKININVDNWRDNLDAVVKLANKGLPPTKQITSAQLVTQMKNESKKMAKLFNLKDLPPELKFFGYSQDHLLGIREALELNDPKIARQTLNTMVGTTRAQNTFLGFKEFGNERRKLITDFNAAPPKARGPIVQKLNDLTKKFIPDQLEYGVRKDGSMKVKVLQPQKTLKSRRESYISEVRKLPTNVQEGMVKKGSPLFKKLMKFCPKSSGGEAGVCTIDEAMKGMISESKQLQSGNMNDAQAKKTAQKIRAVTRVGTGSTLAGLLGPYGVAGEVVIDGSIMANNMLDGGDTYKEALSKSLIKYAMPTADRKKLEKETDLNTMILGSDTSGLAADYADALKKDKDLQQKYENYLKVNQEDMSSLQDPYSSGTTPMFSTGDKNKAERELIQALERAEPTYGKSIYETMKFGSPEQQAFATKQEVFDAQKMQNRMDYDRKILGPLKDLFGTGFYSPAQLKQLELKADRDTAEIGQIPDELKTQQIADFGGVANLAKGGRAGFSKGSLRKGVLSLIDEGIKKTPKDTTTRLDKLIKQTLDEDFFDKKDRIVDTLNFKAAKERKNFPYNQQVFEEPSQLDFYRDIKESNFKTKTGPFFDYQKRKNKAGGGLLKQAGDRSGPPPESGPNPQGLQGLLNRVKKT